MARYTPNTTPNILTDLQVDGTTIVVDESNNRLGIGQDTPVGVLNVSGSTTAAVPTLRVDHADQNVIAMDINADNNTATVLAITADALTQAGGGTAMAGFIGSAIDIGSDSPSTTKRSLVTIKNDNTLAVGTACLTVWNDAIQSGGHESTFQVITTAAETSPLVKFTNANAGAHGVILEIVKDANFLGSGAAGGGDGIGTIRFVGDDDGGTSTDYATLVVTSERVTNSNENGNLVIKTMFEGEDTEVARSNPESYTDDTYCGGFAHRRPVFAPGEDEELSPEMSGCVITLGNAARAITLPEPELGLHYTFVLTAALTAGNATITATTDGSTSSALFTGVLNNNGTSTQKINLAVITFADDTALEGDVVHVTCISDTTTANNPTWFFEAHSSVNNGITIA